MDLITYEKFLDQKISDAKHTLDHAAKEYLEAKAKYELVLFERDSFINAIKDGDFKKTLPDGNKP
jgi:hypothetical protein